MNSKSNIFLGFCLLIFLVLLKTNSSTLGEEKSQYEIPSGAKIKIDMEHNVYDYRTGQMTSKKSKKQFMLEYKGTEKENHIIKVQLINNATYIPFVTLEFKKTVKVNDYTYSADGLKVYDSKYNAPSPILLFVPPQILVDKETWFNFEKQGEILYVKKEAENNKIKLTIITYELCAQGVEKKPSFNTYAWNDQKKMLELEGYNKDKILYKVSYAEVQIWEPQGWFWSECKRFDRDGGEIASMTGTVEKDNKNNGKDQGCVENKKGVK